MSDIFNSAGDIQTPYFSTQCDGTELFFEKNSNVLAYLQSLHPETSDINDNSQSNIDAVKAYLGKCRDDGDVKSMLEKIQDALNNWKLEHSFLNEFYECECKTNFPYEYHRYHEDTSLVKMLHGRMEKENCLLKWSIPPSKNKILWWNLFFQAIRIFLYHINPWQINSHLFSLSTLRPWIAICPTM